MPGAKQLQWPSLTPSSHGPGVVSRISRALAAGLMIAVLLAACGGDEHGALTVTQLQDRGPARYEQRSTLTGKIIEGSLKRPPPESRIDLYPLGADSAVVQLIDDQNRVQPVLLDSLSEEHFKHLKGRESLTVTGKLNPTGMYFADGVYIDADLVPVPTPTAGLPFY